MTPDLPFPHGLLLCIEGIDGAGKTTQIRRLAAALTSVGNQVTITKEPTDGPHGSRVRASATSGRLEPGEELKELLLDRRQHVREVIVPALQSGSVVILDRYFWSSMAYQGSTMGNPEAILAENLSFAPVPDLTLFLDVPVEVSQERIIARDGQPNDFERKDFLTSCRSIFMGIRHPKFLPVDANREPGQVAAEILAHVIAIGSKKIAERLPGEAASKAMRTAFGDLLPLGGGIPLHGL